MNDDDRAVLEEFLRSEGLPQGRVYVARLDDLQRAVGTWIDAGVIGNDGLIWDEEDAVNDVACPGCGQAHDNAPLPLLLQLIAHIGDRIDIQGDDSEAAILDPRTARPEPTLDERIDRAIDGLCPCGGQPDPQYGPYCGYDCVPTVTARDTDPSAAGEWRLATPMRWRPDLVSAVDDDLEPCQERVTRGQFWASAFHRSGSGRLHLRLNDGHRFVGLDVDPPADRDAVQAAWGRLERQLTSPAALDPEPSSEPQGPCDCPQCRSIQPQDIPLQVASWSWMSWGAR